MKKLMTEWRNYLQEDLPKSRAAYAAASMKQDPEAARAGLEKDVAAAAGEEGAFEDREDLKTVGDLKQLIAQAKRLKNTNAMKGELGATIKTIFTFGGSDLAKILQSTYRLPDDVNPGPGLQHLDVDDHVSAIVDDNLENDFLKTLGAELKTGKIPDDTPLPNLDITRMLSNFIQRKHDKRTVTVPEET
jgi:hypothetical protein